MALKRLPVGIENFEEIIKDDYYYVDKTQMIADLIADGAKVTLFTRPRRFGKSLNMSMLKYFFEIGQDKSIFAGLKIADYEDLCDKYMGKYPVVSISLKGVDGLTFESAYDRLRVLIRNEALRLDVLRESRALTSNEHDTYIRLVGENATPADITSSLQTLCTLLEKHYGQKAVLLIDEYDVPLDTAYIQGYYPQMIDLIRSMFSAALKTNNSLQLAVLTGCLRVSKESLFSGLNNLRVRTISEQNFDESFGFTDDEVRQILSYYGKDDHYDETREWYDGYRFGSQYIYCPWDVINYCADLKNSTLTKPKAYWINTSGNDMIRKLISKATKGTTRREIERLIEGETITRTLNENLTHNEIEDSIENIWSLLYMTGYLTITDLPDGNVYNLRIPNKEICEIYKQQVLSWFKDKTEAETDKLSALYTAFEAGDTKTITEMLNKELLYTISYHDAYESFYHGFLLALLSSCAEWDASSNIESGKGRSDILVERDDFTLGFIVELKVVKDDEELETACDTALNQIEDKDYMTILRRDRVKNIMAYGIAFCRKQCMVKVKTL